VDLRFDERRRLVRLVLRFVRRAGFRFAAFRFRFLAGISTTSSPNEIIFHYYFQCTEKKFVAQQCYTHYVLQITFAQLFCSDEV
jgi:hypothetical protein